MNLIALLSLSCGVTGTDEQKPVASFSMSCHAFVDSTITFTNSSLHSTSFHWDFGDGRSSTDENPSIVFADTGTYRISLTSSNGDASDSESHLLTIYPSIPARRVLAIPFVSIDTNNYEWAVTCEMVLRYFDVNVSSCEIVSNYHHGDCCTRQCDSWYTTDVIPAVLKKHADLESDDRQIPITLDEIKMEIAQDRPVIVVYRGEYQNLDVIYGYEQNGRVYMYDPYSGTHLDDYQSLLLQDAGGYQLNWEETICCIRRE